MYCFIAKRAVRFAENLWGAVRTKYTSRLCLDSKNVSSAGRLSISRLGNSEIIQAIAQGFS